MKTIWKFPLAITDEQSVMVPKGARALSVGIQDGQLVMWCEVVPGQDTIFATVSVRGTGHPLGIADGLGFVGTAIDRGRALVWHVYADGLYG